MQTHTLGLLVVVTFSLSAVSLAHGHSNANLKTLRGAKAMAEQGRPAHALKALFSVEPHGIRERLAFSSAKRAAVETVLSDAASAPIFESTSPLRYAPKSDAMINLHILKRAGKLNLFEKMHLQDIENTRNKHMNNVAIMAGTAVGAW